MRDGNIGPFVDRGIMVCPECGGQVVALRRQLYRYGKLELHFYCGSHGREFVIVFEPAGDVLTVGLA